MAEAQDAELQCGFYNKAYKPAYNILECKKQLMHDFRDIYAQDITRILEFHNGQYAKAHRSLTSVMNKVLKEHPEFQNNQKTRPVCNINVTLQNDDAKSQVFTIQTMANIRTSHKKCHPSHELRQEMAFATEQVKLINEKEDRNFAMTLNEEEYKETGQFIECGCCFGNCVFENMAQCMEGHLVCVECLNAFTKETVFGTGKVMLGCMVSDCKSMYPQCELARCISPKTRAKLEERDQMENLNMAGVEDLVKCPYCDFAAILPAELQKFECYRDTCAKVTCRKCGTDWADHEGLLCSEVEKRDETLLRKKYEEKMTMARVRTCNFCKAQFTKTTGCNKITCRCGTTMCYLCRQQKINYAHFCQHPRDPGKPCSHCASCSLWTNPKHDEERAIKEMKQEAERMRKALGFEGEKQIGVPTAKKFKH